MRTLMLFFLIACSSTKTGSSVGGTAPSGAPGEIVHDTLLREIGQSHAVAIIGGEVGLRAVSSDGARSRVLAPGNVWFVLIDGGVVWYGVEREIRAIDLYAKKLEVHVVAEGLPAPGGMVGPQNVSIATYEPNADPPIPSEARLSGAIVFRTFIVELHPDGKAQISGSSGYEESEEFDQTMKQARIVDAAWLKSLVGRELAPSKIVPKPAPPATKEIAVPGIDPADCYTPEMCGKGQIIPGTHYAKVLISHVVGDIGHLTYKLYDVDAKKFIEGTDEYFGFMMDASVADDGSAFVAFGQIIGWDGKPIVKGGSLGGAFLDGYTF